MVGNIYLNRILIYYFTNEILLYYIKKPLRLFVEKLLESYTQRNMKVILLML